MPSKKQRANLRKQQKAVAKAEAEWLEQLDGVADYWVERGVVDFDGEKYGLSKAFLDGTLPPDPLVDEQIDALWVIIQHIKSNQ